MQSKFLIFLLCYSLYILDRFIKSFMRNVAWEEGVGNVNELTYE